MTALHVSCNGPHASEEIIEMLLEAGADPTIANNRSFSSLHHSARTGCLKYVNKYCMLILFI